MSLEFGPPISAPILGRVLFNTGKPSSPSTGQSWKDPLSTVPTASADAGSQVPESQATRATPTTTFIDLDGDGVTDLASKNNGVAEHLPAAGDKGLSERPRQEDGTDYKVITTADAQSDADRPGHPTYQDSTSGPKPLPLASGTSFMTTPLRVVASLAADDGIGGTAITDYEYRDLRASPSGRGPQGFSHRHRDRATGCEPASWQAHPDRDQDAICAAIPLYWNAGDGNTKSRRFVKRKRRSH